MVQAMAARALLWAVVALVAGGGGWLWWEQTKSGLIADGRAIERAAQIEAVAALNARLAALTLSESKARAETELARAEKVKEIVKTIEVPGPERVRTVVKRVAASGAADCGIGPTMQNKLNGIE